MLIKPLIIINLIVFVNAFPGPDKICIEDRGIEKCLSLSKVRKTLENVVQEIMENRTECGNESSTNPSLKCNSRIKRNAIVEENEDNRCTRHGKSGHCVSIRDCQANIVEIYTKFTEYLCGFSKNDSNDVNVCCIEEAVDNTSYEMNVFPWLNPMISDEPVGTSDRVSACDHVSAGTAKKIGVKAWDKCVEYQQKLLYPCTENEDGSFTRKFHCNIGPSINMIYGGTNSLPDQYPHMVLLGYGNASVTNLWECGGTLISENFVLTAGHCTFDTRLSVSDVAVGILNRTEVSDPSKVFKVKRIIKHPEYKPPSLYHDIALLELEKPVPLSEKIVPACLYTGSLLDLDEATITGWGKYEDGDQAEVLQTADITRFDDGECFIKMVDVSQNRLHKGYDPETQLCYGFKDVCENEVTKYLTDECLDKLNSGEHKKRVKDTCKGDSGGPLQVKSSIIDCMYNVIGITSFGRSNRCDIPGQPGVYTRVEHYVPWIESVVWPDE